MDGSCLDVYHGENFAQAHFCVPDPSGSPGPPQSQAWHLDRNSSSVRWRKPDFDWCLQANVNASAVGAAPQTEVWEKQLQGGDVALLGFVDLQVNGCGGISFSDAALTAASCRAACLQLLTQGGCAAILPTVITSSREKPGEA